MQVTQQETVLIQVVIKILSWTERFLIFSPVNYYWSDTKMVDLGL